MSVVASLAGVISPGVAAEAAKIALHQLTDGDTKVAPEEDQKEATAEESKHAEGTPAEDEEKKDDEKMDSEEDKPKEEGATAQDDMQVDAESQAQRAVKTIPHSKVVRAADLALKSASKAAGALADAEDLQIRSTLASLIKLTLTKLELKTAQFEELEELLEDERKSLESARMALVNERVNLRRLLDNVKSELAKHGAMPNPGLANAVAQAQTGLGASGQGTKVNEVAGGAPADGDQGPVTGGNIAQLS